MSDKPERKPVITVQLDMDAVTRIDKIADKMGLSRSKVASNLLSSGMVGVEFVGKTGLLRLGLWLDWLISKVKAHDSEVEKVRPDVEKMTVTVHIPTDEYDYLGKVSEAVFLTRAKFASNIIVSNLPTLENLDKWGVVDLVMHFRKAKENALQMVGKVKAEPETD
ncbi:hypothetical protein FACS189460_1000 [Deltaproteobacteria bacterium]|nr:hypothetical protein FACS189460_1000 [Deltaproteobacteria bacterium]